MLELFMSNTSKKRQRRVAATNETAKRRREAEAISPLSRSELTELWNAVAEQLAVHGHDGKFRIAESWFNMKGIESAPVLNFLRSHDINNDFEIIISCDPNKLFGPSPDRLALMPISKTELLNLLAWVDEHCRKHGCDHTHRFTKAWLQANQRPLATTEMALLAQGGGCDCEVVLNVDPDEIYPMRDET